MVERIARTRADEDSSARGRTHASYVIAPVTWRDSRTMSVGTSSGRAPDMMLLRRIRRRRLRRAHPRCLQPGAYRWSTSASATRVGNGEVQMETRNDDAAGTVKDDAGDFLKQAPPGGSRRARRGRRRRTSATCCVVAIDPTPCLLRSRRWAPNSART